MEYKFPKIFLASSPLLHLPRYLHSTSRQLAPIDFDEHHIITYQMDKMLSCWQTKSLCKSKNNQIPYPRVIQF